MNYYVVKLVHLVTKREYKDINNVRNELKAFNNQELMKTYESILNYEELAKIHGSLTIESNNCHSFINTIEKRA